MLWPGSGYSLDGPFLVGKDNLELVAAYLLEL